MYIKAYTDLNENNRQVVIGLVAFKLLGQHVHSHMCNMLEY